MRKEYNLRLSKREFEVYAHLAKLGENTKAAAYRVIVKGEKKADVAREFCVSRAAIGAAIKRVCQAYDEKNIPSGMEKITVILPSYRAYIVKKWAKEIESALDHAT